ncbi:MAG TPA: hypothetical protein ENI70_01060 [Candidatus Peregrinibacteria bacterium]|nr:hypothetical protein [Candidatus Peregrinibacteria bacterium]
MPEASIPESTTTITCPGNIEENGSDYYASLEKEQSLGLPLSAYKKAWLEAFEATGNSLYATLKAEEAEGSITPEEIKTLQIRFGELLSKSSIKKKVKNS